MGRGASIERALQDAVELRALARTAEAGGDLATGRRLRAIARRRAADIGPSVPKSRAVAVLGVSLTTLDKWIGRGSLPILRPSGSSREELQTDAVLELADHVHDLRQDGRTRALLATAIGLRQAANGETKRPRMGSRRYFPDQQVERRRDLELTPGERVVQAIKLSRTATRISAAATADKEPGRRKD